VIEFSIPEGDLWAGISLGSVTRKVVPFPTSLTTSTHQSSRLSNLH
jgi:hypothetical protein